MKEYEELKNEIDQGKKMMKYKSILITGALVLLEKLLLKILLSKRNQKVSNF